MSPVAVEDRGHWVPQIRVEKWATDEAYRRGAAPDEVVEDIGNLLLNAGIQRLEDLLLGVGGQVLNATHCRIGVGDSSTAPAASQTDLQAASNKMWKLVTTGPTRASQTMTAVVAFATGEANFAWNEWGIDFGQGADPTGAVIVPLLNRRAAAGLLGTKVSGTWTITVTITIS